MVSGKKAPLRRESCCFMFCLQTWLCCSTFVLWQVKDLNSYIKFQVKSTFLLAMRDTLNKKKSSDFIPLELFYEIFSWCFCQMSESGNCHQLHANIKPRVNRLVRIYLRQWDVTAVPLQGFLRWSWTRCCRIRLVSYIRVLIKQTKKQLNKQTVIRSC